MSEQICTKCGHDDVNSPTGYCQQIVGFHGQQGVECGCKCSFSKAASERCGVEFAQPFGVSEPITCDFPKGHKGGHGTPRDSDSAVSEEVPLTKPYKDHLRESLQTLDDYVGYLSACHDEGQDVFQLAVKDVLSFRSVTVDEAAIRRAAENVLNSFSVNEFREMQRLNKYHRIAEIIASEMKNSDSMQQTTPALHVEKDRPLAIFDAGFSGEPKPNTPLADVEGKLAAEADGQAGLLPCPWCKAVPQPCGHYYEVLHGDPCFLVDRHNDAPPRTIIIRRQVEDWNTRVSYDASKEYVRGRHETWDEAINWIRDQWLAAYPVEVFPEPPPPPAECSRDSISAAMGRHIATRLIEEFESFRALISKDNRGERS